MCVCRKIKHRCTKNYNKRLAAPRTNFLAFFYSCFCGWRRVGRSAKNDAATADCFNEAAAARLAAVHLLKET